MVKLAEAGTEALTVDAKLKSIGKLKDLGLELGKLDTKNLTFATVPVKDNPAEKTPVTVVLKDGPAQQVFDMVKNDVSFTEVKEKEKEKKKKEDAAVAARLEGEKSEPGEIRVRVMNGGASSGSAGRELTYLQNEAGVTKSENAATPPPTSRRPPWSTPRSLSSELTGAKARPIRSRRRPRPETFRRRATPSTARTPASAWTSTSRIDGRSS
ncbi:hypothetical protein SVIOM74S_02332 [Streptomyces violarus]